MISRLAIKNYRSLRNVELRPGPLTVLIGPNGAGKSNIIDALRFLKEIHSVAPRSAGKVTTEQLEERGGYEQVVWGGMVDEKIEFEDGVLQWRKGTRYPGFRVEIQDSPGPYLRSDTFPIGAEKWDRRGRRGRHQQRVSESGQPPQSMAVLQLLPASMRKPTKVKQESVLNETGSNLSTVIHSLYSEGHPDLEEAVGMLKVMVPTVERLTSPIFGDGQTYVALKEKGIKQPTGAWGLIGWDSAGAGAVHRPSRAPRARAYLRGVSGRWDPSRESGSCRGLVGSGVA